MIRIVIDTNVLVSAMLSGRGHEARVVQIARVGFFQACVSPPLLEEYKMVLRRPVFRFEKSTVEQLLCFLHSGTLLVTPGKRIDIFSDEPDNRFLECAEAAQADYLVTGNKRHFPREWKNTRIVNARELLLAALM